MKFRFRLRVRRVAPYRFELVYGLGARQLVDTVEGGRRQPWRIVGRDDLGTDRSFRKLRNRWGDWASGMYELHPLPNVSAQVVAALAPPPPPSPRVVLSPRRARTRGSIPVMAVDGIDGVTTRERDLLLTGSFK